METAAAAGSSGSPAAGSGGSSQPAAPVAVTDPALGPNGLGSMGIAVNDLDKAADFFVQNFEMKVDTPAIEREDRTERVLAYDNNNTTLTLMKYKDGRMIVGCYDVNACTAKNVPGKVVFSMRSPSATGQKVVAAGYKSVLNAGAIVQVSAIDDYLIEILQGDSAVIALAIAVTEFQKTNDFYVMAFGLNSTGTYNDPRMSGLQEAFYADPAGGAAIVVQHYTQGEWNYKDNPMKTLWRVNDAAAALMKVVSLGGTMVSPAAPHPAFNNKPTAIAKDADGYLIELVQK
jgi:predicted enzyme related to lactoylglutathione lyase